MAPGRITVLSDASTYLNSFLSELIAALWQRGLSANWLHDPAHLSPGVVCLLLSCSRLLSAVQLTLYRQTWFITIAPCHSSLPQGQG